MNGKKTVFTGVGTALITPFLNGEIDYKSYKNILEMQVANNVDAVIVCGTTGEAATLTDTEHRAIIEYTVNEINGRIPVIAGTGSNETAYSIELTRFAKECGADAVLLVTPYYNKTTQKGLVKHFTAIADCADIPNLLYNVPSRTGLNIGLDTYKTLACHPNIVGVKEASANISFIMDVFQACGDKLDIYSGNDDHVVPLLAMGGKGVISVLSNIMPAETSKITSLWFEGKTKESANLQLKYLPLINALFMQVNPVPVKAAMSKMGLCTPELRLPLCEMDEPDNEKLYALMREQGLLQ